MHPTKSGKALICHVLNIAQSIVDSELVHHVPPDSQSPYQTNKIYTKRASVQRAQGAYRLAAQCNCIDRGANTFTADSIDFVRTKATSEWMATNRFCPWCVRLCCQCVCRRWMWYGARSSQSNNSEQMIRSLWSWSRTMQYTTYIFRISFHWITVTDSMSDVHAIVLLFFFPSLLQNYDCVTNNGSSSLFWN